MPERDELFIATSGSIVIGNREDARHNQNPVPFAAITSDM